MDKDIFGIKRKMLQEMEEKVRRQEAVLKRTNIDPLQTWNDHEIKAVEGHPDYIGAVEESRLARKLQVKEERRLFEAKRALADLKVQSLFPEAQDPKFQVRVEDIIIRYDLHGNPNARLIAARLAKEENQ